jgi:7-cyano-7-deazaguanine synthase
MYPHDGPSTIGVLFSGGLDSSILLAHLLGQGHTIRPFYVRSRLVWEALELAACRQFLQALRCDRLQDLVTLELPLDDLYDGHWSVTGRNTPDATSPDTSVYMPGRNALLIIKAAVWCQLHGIPTLALAPLGTNPFADATAAFFTSFETALNQGVAEPLRIVRPFADTTKRQVMALGSRFPLHLTFSCISPRNGLHCGTCNKCAERRMAFEVLDSPDPTRYAT